ncbi:MAG: hypothetical protein KKE05_02290 [Nanoarchaeota archaeon]|nr:hypothetical protein [Nanoarchaeota archaeon]
MLSHKKFRKYRYGKCVVCGKVLDKLSRVNTIVSFTRPSPRHEKYYEWKGLWTHKSCASRIKIPKGWGKFGK